jgi:signal transduction histidine kinase/CheY-like chemotaxis protein
LLNAIHDFLSTEGFQPHGMCLLWRSDVFWAHVVSDLVIALAYFSIPVALVFFTLRRPDLRHRGLLALCGLFVVGCGVTHLFGLWTIWVPDYGAAAIAKALTAIASVVAAVAIWVRMPALLAMPSADQLEANNAHLAREVAERKAAEHRLADLNACLERRVAERTESLARANGELRAARARAEKTSAAKSDFLAAMSHEIRTPMNGVLGILDLLRDEPSEAERSRYLGLARDSALGLLAVINDILDHSRLEARSLTLEATPFDPSEPARKVVGLLGEGAKEKGIALVADLSSELSTPVVGDPTRLRQVLFNLVGNAIKFTEHGSITVTARRTPLSDGRIELRFEVADTGIGMSPEVRARIFGRFAQADDSTARRYGGSGLGLAISRELVRLMGGEIGVESVEGAGSRFWFTVRCPAGAGENAAAQDAPELLIPAPGKRILVVEDNEVNQLLVGRMLQKGGHAVEIVRDGGEAVARIEREAFDVVLMDVHLPGIDGVTATRRIRALAGAAATIPIIALTANAMKGDRDGYLAAGMDDYVSKPIDASALQAAIARVLRGVRAEPERDARIA